MATICKCGKPIDETMRQAILNDGRWAPEAVDTCLDCLEAEDLQWLIAHEEQLSFLWDAAHQDEL